MSQAKNDASEKLMINANAQAPASERIPIIARPFVSDRAKKTLDIVCPFPTFVALVCFTNSNRVLGFWEQHQISNETNGNY